MIKERPIPFSPMMIEALLAGRKTQTRRNIPESFNGCLTNGGPHPCSNEPIVMYPGEIVPSAVEGEPDIVIDWTDRVEAHFHCSTLDSVAKCRYGKTGDILYVKESFSILDCWEADKTVHVLYHGGSARLVRLTDEEWEKFWKWSDDKKFEGKQISSLFMFKSLSRIWLEVEAIRVEALHDISAQDVLAEGVGEKFNSGARSMTSASIDLESWQTKQKWEFKLLWKKINGEESWSANPWLWVISFKVLSTTGKPKV